jgi:hypothetical protein
MYPRIYVLGAYIGLIFDHAVTSESGKSSLKGRCATPKHPNVIPDACWVVLLACSWDMAEQAWFRARLEQGEVQGKR